MLVKNNWNVAYVHTRQWNTDDASDYHSQSNKLNVPGSAVKNKLGFVILALNTDPFNILHPRTRTNFVIAKNPITAWTHIITLPTSEYKSATK